MKGPCPYCGTPYVTRTHLDAFTRQLLHEIDDHECPRWAPKPALDPEPTDTSFIREARNSPEGLAAYRDYLKGRK